MAGELQDGVETDVETIAPKAPVTYRRTAVSDDIGIEMPLMDSGFTVSSLHQKYTQSETRRSLRYRGFVPSKFEEIFSKFAKTEKTRMTFWELMERTAANRNAVDPFGWIAGKGEWSVTYWLLKDKEGFLSKEAIRGMFDGSIFEKVEQMRKSKAQ